ncbi:OX-2 membrane glycoprotein-like [Rana temporaria]|uniref:OX-2 membrane glycoprotein-like n=1 Tax=Rana temporaria TaxID=8407 RepID=UPI001AAD6C85|nr:OX-2 membrane glycoprotein-like [Rana temporaria]
MTGLILLLLLSLCCSAHSSVIIISTEKQAATVGGNVTLQCRLQASQPNIFQVTWQKETGNFTGPVATCSKMYGERIMGHLSNRTEQRTVDTLNVSAITISPVTLEDQGCFKCIFNVYPFGANFGTACLEVHERNISDPILEIHPAKSPDSSEKMHVVTCSATGKPAPEISWNATGSLASTPQVYTIDYPNGAVTTISNFTLRVPRGMEEKVVCVVSHPALPSDKYLSGFLKDTTTEDSVGDPKPGIIVIIVTIVFLVLSLICVWRKKCHKHAFMGKNYLDPHLQDNTSSTSSSDSEKALLPNGSQCQKYGELPI